MDGVLRHANISIFVPHAGCPNKCIFCDQRTISGITQRTTPEDVCNAAETALRTLGNRAADAELAFFGGSFTAIEREYMLSLLKAAKPYIGKAGIGGIRCSTRPDAIDGEVLSLLREYGVTSIELGAQSMNDEVLRLNKRGHTAQDTVRASNLIKNAGFSLGLQMMTGMYGDTLAGAQETAEKLALLEPDTVRIYPVVVLENTELAALYREGKYVPESLEATTELCARLLLMFEGRGIRVIKLGLHASESVERGMIAGIYHPAFRELCESKIYLSRALEQLGDYKGEAILRVAPGGVSKMIGQKKSCLSELERRGVRASVCADPEIKEKYEIRITEVS